MAKAIINGQTIFGNVHLGNPIVTETKTGSILTFNSVLPVVADDVSSLISGYQEGSGTPAPDNVRNLVSFDECNVSRTGINIWDEVWEVGSITWDTGKNDSRTDRIRSKNYIPVCPNTSYFINVPRGGGSYHQTDVFFYNKDKSFISSLFVNVNQSQRTITTPANCYYIRFCPYAVYGTTYNNDISINYPSTDTSYHSGKADKYYTLSFGKTIYEGTIDFTTGVLTATKVAKVFNGSESWGLHPGIPNWFWVDEQLEDAYISATSADFANSNMYVQRRYDEASVLSEGQFAIGIPSSGAPVRLAVKDTNQATVSDFKTFLNSNNLQIAYTLASPLEIQLAPTEISLLQGTNNLWSSTGNLTVQFKNVK